MRRGRKSEPCPDVAKLRELHATGRTPNEIARCMDRSRKSVVRWLGEIGVELPPPRKQRPRGVTPRYVWGARRSSDGKRVVCSLYESWHSMRVRCRAPGYRDYRYYGGRGITVCGEWDDYANFRAWAIANGFAKGLSIDRIDSTGNYEPSNCRWATRQEQTYNLPTVHRLTLNGVTKLLPIWARELGMPIELLRTRKRAGWTDEQILTTPRLSPGRWREGVEHGRRGRRSKEVRARKIKSGTSGV